MNEPTELQIRISPKRTLNTVRLLTADDLLSFEEESRDGNASVPLQELLVEGFLSFGERTFFEFGKLNILVGPNGAGKSNLVDCVRMLRYAPLDIQETFQDSGFEEWLYRGSDLQSDSAFFQITVNLSEIRTKILHQIRLGPPQKKRACPP